MYFFQTSLLESAKKSRLRNRKRNGHRMGEVCNKGAIFLWLILKNDTLIRGLYVVHLSGFSGLIASAGPQRPHLRAQRHHQYILLLHVAEICWGIFRVIASIWRMCINTILLNESRHIVSIAAILASKCPTYGYPPSLFLEASEAKIGPKRAFLGKTRCAETP